MERMSGEDASFIHLERMGEPCHTLKLVVLDTSERGHPVTLDELRRTVAAYLPVYPRARQRVVSAPVLRGLPFWVDDPDFDLDRHVSECVLPAPGGRRQLDDVCSGLASDRLDLSHPLWDATLVHGLEGGRQAVVFRIHHALTDGMGVVRLLERVTSSTPQPPAPAPPDRWSPDPLPSATDLLQAAIRGVPRTVGLAQSMLAHGWRNRSTLIEGRRQAKERDDLRASGLTAPYTWTNPGISTRRLCATGSLPLADLLVVKERVGCTLNGVMLAVLAGALRRESEERGCGLDDDMVCGLGMALAGDDENRLWGNNLTNVNVSLHTTVPDPVDRLHRIARSVTDTVVMQAERDRGAPGERARRRRPAGTDPRQAPRLSRRPRRREPGGGQRARARLGPLRRRRRRRRVLQLRHRRAERRPERDRLPLRQRHAGRCAGRPRGAPSARPRHRPDGRVTRGAARGDRHAARVRAAPG